MGAILCCSNPYQQKDFEESESRTERRRLLDRSILDLELSIKLYIAIQKQSEALKNIELIINEFTSNKPNNIMYSECLTDNKQSEALKNIEIIMNEFKFNKTNESNKTMYSELLTNNKKSYNTNDI